MDSCEVYEYYPYAAIKDLPLQIKLPPEIGERVDMMQKQWVFYKTLPGGRSGYNGPLQIYTITKQPPEIGERVDKVQKQWVFYKYLQEVVVDTTVLCQRTQATCG
ncbi:hypothetical protein KFK09_026754 [Dendrobium nobile]|uniref:Uncharacterized protein n=1 Tax=Dendrobium nobile TaxID=94219 RepID=A0A8T3A965_DENNO|nr:hypothetical protein KFK09_026754 [Dendrobium nobile]